MNKNSDTSFNFIYCSKIDLHSKQTNPPLNFKKNEFGVELNFLRLPQKIGE